MEFAANEQASRESGRYPWEETTHGVLGWLYGARDRTLTAAESTQRGMLHARDAAGANIRQHPFGAVALALAVGFAAGVLIARR